jgi:hypothetical protein
MPTRGLLARFRCIHWPRKDLNLKRLSKPISDQTRNPCSKRQAFDIPSKSRRPRPARRPSRGPGLLMKAVGKSSLIIRVEITEALCRTEVELA